MFTVSNYLVVEHSEAVNASYYWPGMYIYVMTCICHAALSKPAARLELYSLFLASCSFLLYLGLETWVNCVCRQKMHLTSGHVLIMWQVRPNYQIMTWMTNDDIKVVRIALHIFKVWWLCLHKWHHGCDMYRLHDGCNYLQMTWGRGGVCFFKVTSSYS